MARARETYDEPDAATLIYADACAKDGASVTMDGTMLHIDWPDTRDVADQSAERLQQLADRRWATMIRTPIGPGVWITSDDTAIARINAKIAAMERGGVPTIDWKLDSGAYVSLTLDQLKATGLAMDSHWTACWANEAVLAARILAAADAAALDAVDISAGWPQ